MSDLVPNCCVNCYWLDGFTGECIVKVDQLYEHDIYKTPCPNPMYFQAGQGHCIDNHDVWRDNAFHKERILKHRDWLKEATAHKLQVKKQIEDYLKWYQNIEAEQP